MGSHDTTRSNDSAAASRTRRAWHRPQLRQEPIAALTQSTSNSTVDEAQPASSKTS